MLWILIAAFAFVLGYWMLTRHYEFWTRKGVKQGKPIFFFGENRDAFFGKQSFADLIGMVYEMFPDCRYSGFYQFFLPTLVLRDPDLIKDITIKNFDHFMDHRTIVPEDADPLWANNLFSLTGKNWHDMRVTLSPTFTSSKMKFIFSLISQNGERFVKHFLNKKDGIITVEMKDILTRFTNDAIASTAFGIECDSLAERNNEFYLMGKETTDFTGFWKRFRFYGYILAPRLLKYFKFRFFSEEVDKFFTNLIKTNIESREKHGIVRPDMIHLLLQARKNNNKQEEEEVVIKDAGFATVEEFDFNKASKNRKREITDKDIISQALVFFFAGFDGIANVMSFTAYELAINPDIQKRLIEEIDETRKLCKDNLTYEALAGMKYLDMVVSESLRKWPNAPAVDRICTKPYIIEPKLPGEKPLLLEKGSVLWLPIWGIHRDAKYWPEPERFDPERFSDENKDKIKPYTYIPFGAGPRNCIGSRFALLETKTLFYYILSYFEIVPTEKTQIPLKLSTKSLNMKAENGFWLGLKRRTKA